MSSEERSKAGEREIDSLKPVYVISFCYQVAFVGNALIWRPYLLYCACMRSLSKALWAVLSLPVMLNSCYFNSTGSLIDKAQYEARANAADLNVSPNPVVYQNGSNYYIELPRYRYGHPVKLQYSVFDQESPMEASMEPRGMGMYRISEEYARYLTGQGKKTDELFSMQEVANADEVKMLSRRIPVVKKADDHMVAYSYESPNSGWLYAAVPFNWLLVDLPVTVVENAVIVAGVAGVIWLLAEADDDCDDCHHHHHKPHKHGKHKKHHKRHR